MKRFSKIVWSTILVLLLAGAGWFYFSFYFVFGEGVKAGELNFIVKKGYVFKTYEGKIIQSGFKGSSSAKGQATTGGIQSYEFEFSIQDPVLADSLMRCGGREVELRYKEYMHSLPWRGNSKYLVYGIVNVR